MLFKTDIICSCGHKNTPSSKFCGKCGLPIGTSEAVCPACGAKVTGNDAFCGKCGTKLSGAASVSRTAATSKELDKHHAWGRVPGDFAQRFEVEDVRGFFAKKVTIEQGTKAIFLQGGVYNGFLPAGVYDLGNIFSTLGSLKLDRRATIILVDSGEAALTFMLAKSELRSKNGIAVSASGKITVRISDPLLYLENYLKRESHVSLNDMEENLHGELLGIASSVVSGYSVDELYGNAALRDTLNREFSTRLNAITSRRGIEVLYLNCAGFDEGAWKEVLAARETETVAAEKAKAEYTSRSVLRRAETQDRIETIEAAHAVRSRDEVLANERKTANLGYELRATAMVKDQRREQDAKDFAQDMGELNALSDLQARKRRSKIDDFDSASIETRILMTGGSAADVKDLEKMKRAQSLTPEQILAMNARDPRAAAEALAARAKLSSVEELNALRIKDQRAFNAMMQEQYRENAEQMKEVMNSALAAMGSTATARATAQNPGATVVSGGRPVVVQGHPQGGRRCSSCGAEVPAENLFCPECGKEVRK